MPPGDLPSQRLPMHDVLPPEVYDAEILPLLPPEARRALRQACRHGRQDADSRSTRVVMDAWDTAHGHCARYLARLPHLTGLTLSEETTPAMFAAAMVACGPAASSRVTRLALRGPLPSEDFAGYMLPAALQRMTDASPFVRAATMADALCMTLPRLTDLDLEDTSEGVAASAFVRYLPLYLTPVVHLTKLVIKSEVSCPQDVLLALGGLESLLHLEVRLAPNDFADLRPLSNLVSLRHCDCNVSPIRSADGVAAYLPLEAASPFFASTHLTSLRVLLANYDGTATPTGEQAVSLAALGALSHLQSLDLWHAFLAGDAACAAIFPLLALTHLGIGGLAPTAVTPGRLPALRSLALEDTESSQRSVYPTELLEVLLPLLPLPSLTSLDDGYLCVDVSRGGDHADAEAAALLAATRHLAAAPRLGWGGTIQLSGSSEAEEQSQLSVAQIAAGLEPLGSAFTCLALHDLDLMGAQWGDLSCLHAALPRLVSLHLKDCLISVPLLASVVRHLEALQQLGMCDCTCEAPDGWSLLCDALAVGCTQALKVGMQPPLPAEDVSYCRAVQDMCFGEQFLTWCLWDDLD